MQLNCQTDLTTMVHHSWCRLRAVGLQRPLSVQGPYGPIPSGEDAQGAWPWRRRAWHGAWVHAALGIPRVHLTYSSNILVEVQAKNHEAPESFRRWFRLRLNQRLNPKAWITQHPVRAFVQPGCGKHVFIRGLSLPSQPQHPYIHLVGRRPPSLQECPADIPPG